MDTINGLVRAFIGLLLVLALVQLVGVIIGVASIIAYHNDPKWYYIATGIAGAALALFADVD